MSGWITKYSSSDILKKRKSDPTWLVLCNFVQNIFIGFPNFQGRVGLLEHMSWEFSIGVPLVYQPFFLWFLWSKIFTKAQLFNIKYVLSFGLLCKCKVDKLFLKYKYIEHEKVSIYGRHRFKSRFFFFHAHNQTLPRYCSETIHTLIGKKEAELKSRRISSLIWMNL